MSADASEKAGQFFAALCEAEQDARIARERTHIGLRDMGLLSQVTLHRFMCRSKGCQLALVFQVGDSVFVAASDYKYSPGMNEEKSVQRARERNTLDGKRHWPGTVYDLNEVVEWGPQGSIHVACRHVMRDLSGSELFDSIGSATPGHPGKPTLLE